MESQLVAKSHDAVKESGASTLQEDTAKAESEIEKLSHVTLNIAVTGVSGTGKSSFVNAIRGVPDGGEGAAPTNEVESTTTPIKYPHPSMPNVKIWDLPGMGVEHFKAAEYLEIVKFDRYYFYVIIVGKRVMENDILLTKEIRGKNKFCYIIRSMIDQAVEAGQRKGKTEEETLAHIRKDLEEKFKQFDGIHIFLVSSLFLDRFDFKDLVKVLENDISEMRNALIQSLQVYSMESLGKKYKTFKNLTWAIAFASGAIGLIPMQEVFAAGVSAAFDILVIMGFLVKVHYSFGLDKKTLHRLSERVNKPTHAQAHESKFIIAVKVTAAALKFIPTFGGMPGAALSFITTLCAIRTGLGLLYKAAKHVWQD